HLSVELLDRWMPMPDPRALRRAFSDPVTRFLLENPRKDGLRGVPSLLLAAQEKIWKPLTLLRGAYTLRVMGEEQLRIAAAGFKAMPNHPASYMAFLVGDSPRVQRMLEKFGKALPDAVTGRAETDIFGGLLRESDEFGAAMFRGGAVFDDEIRLSNYIVYRRGQP